MLYIGDLFCFPKSSLKTEKNVVLGWNLEKKELSNAQVFKVLRRNKKEISK